MEQSPLSSTSVLEILWKTNRPATDQEKAIIQESIAPTNAKLKAIEEEISDTMAHIQALKAQVKQAEIKLQRLREDEATILETSADHRRVLSPFRNLPGDVLREICVACVKADNPTLSYGCIPSTYVLAQISSGMRQIVLTTPFIWSSISIERSLTYSTRNITAQQIYSILARRVSEWLERAGALTLTIFVEDPGYRCARVEDVRRDPSNVLFDVLFSFSARWRSIEFESICIEQPSASLIRIAALTAIDVPLLKSISFRIHFGSSLLCNSPILAIPTLKHLTLETEWDKDYQVLITDFNAVNWAVLTSITIRANSPYYISSIGSTARVLQQTKCLVSCDIAVAPDSEIPLPVSDIDLPFLKTLRVNEKTFERTSSGVSSILDLFHTPILSKLEIPESFLQSCLSNFLKRTPSIQELFLSHSGSEESLNKIIDVLRQCPSLSVLTVWPQEWAWGGKLFDASKFLQAFVDNAGGGEVICPHLQRFEFIGSVNFSLQTLRLFIKAKHRGIPTSNALAPWKRVFIDISAIEDPETYQAMQDFVSQHLEMGVDIETRQRRVVHDDDPPYWTDSWVTRSV